MKGFAKNVRSILSAGFLFFAIAFSAFAGEWSAKHLGVVVTTPDARWKVEVNQISPTVARLSLGDSQNKAHTRLIVSAVPTEVALPLESFVKIHYDAVLKTNFSYPYQAVSETTTNVMFNGGAQGKYVQHEYQTWRGEFRSFGKLYGEAFVDGKKVYFVKFIVNYRLHEPLTFSNPDVQRLIVQGMHIVDERQAGAGQPQQIAAVN